MHKFIKVLVPALSLALLTCGVACSSESKAADKNIVEVAANAGTFKTLLAAAQAAGLADTLADGGPFTVFAPTDAAFAKLPEGTVENLLKPENKAQLQAILKFHVLSGAVPAANVTDGLEAETLQGGALTFAVSEEGVTANGVNIVATDIAASNGVIHVIDAVLLPPAQPSKVKAAASGASRSCSQ